MNIFQDPVTPVRKTDIVGKDDVETTRDDDNIGYEREDKAKVIYLCET